MPCMHFLKFQRETLVNHTAERVCDVSMATLYETERRKTFLIYKINVFERQRDPQSRFFPLYFVGDKVINLSFDI